MEDSKKEGETNSPNSVYHNLELKESELKPIEDIKLREIRFVTYNEKGQPEFHYYNSIEDVNWNPPIPLPVEETTLYRL